MDNMKFYNMGKEVPAEAKKPIKKGNLSGYTDVNPMWRIKKLTEMFGPCGLGWKLKTVKEEYKENPETKEIVFTVKRELYIKYDSEWSEAIEGVGSAMFAVWQNKQIWQNKQKVGEEKVLVSNDEYKKMADTDAISACCKMLGIAADVYYEKDRTKYDLEKGTPPPQNNNWQKGTETNKTTTKNTSMFRPITDKQRQVIFGYLKETKMNKEILDSWLEKNYKKSLSKLSSTEASGVITFVKELAKDYEIDKLIILAKTKGYTEKPILKKEKEDRIEYLSRSRVLNLINEFGKLPDKAVETETPDKEKK